MVFLTYFACVYCVSPAFCALTFPTSWQVYSYMDDYMTSASAKFQGDKFIIYDSGAQYPYGFMQAGF